MVASGMCARKTGIKSSGTFGFVPQNLSSPAATFCTRQADVQADSMTAASNSWLQVLCSRLDLRTRGA